MRASLYTKVAHLGLRMATPVKNHHGVFYLREKVPADLRERVKGRTVSLPVAGEFKTVRIGEAVKLSLKTKETPVARQRFAEAHAALVRFYESVRHGPVALTHKQATALAGKAYHSLVRAAEDEPGPTEKWAKFRDALQGVREGRWSLCIGDDARQAADRELILGAIADRWLTIEQLSIDRESRDKFLKALLAAYDHAGARLEQHAEGDYSPDEAAKRFPDWERPAIQTATPPEAAGKPAEARRGACGGMKAGELFERWKVASVTRVKPATIERYAVSFKSLAAYTKKPVTEITSDDVYAWFEQRRDKEGVSARTINKNDRVAVSSVFSWATTRDAGKLLTANPVKDLETLPEERKARTRDPMFTEDEALTILRASLRVEGEDHRSLAQRWTPWLAAYCGARIGELVTLRAEDIRREGGVWLMHFDETKTDVPRDVPIHSHVIEQGFLAVVGRQGRGPLFYDPARHAEDAKTSPKDIVSRKMAMWVREVAPELPDFIQPNHAWRHTWKSRALAAGVEARMRDIIAGHGPDSVARAYEHADTVAKARAVEVVPRWPV